VTIGPCFGWLHHADGDRGVVLCGSIGYEGLCAHHSWRSLADALAAAGLPTLRFDYPGEGDSLGDSDEPMLLDRWRDSIRAAVGWMRETIGVREVALVGLRLGASLAAEVGGVERLVEIAPVVTGRSYLRELEAMAHMLAATAGAPTRPKGEDVELEGFVLSSATCAAIRSVDLTRLSAAPAPRILVMRDPATRSVADHVARLEALGAAVETRDFADYAALTPAPLPAPPPSADFAAIVAFVGDGAARARIAAPAPSELATDVFVETALRFGECGRLAGVLCLPRSAPSGAVLMLDTGANHHIGCGRSAVLNARALAEMGVASLRMDSLGIGESAPVAGGPRSALYREERAEDVVAALDCLAARGLRRITLFGVCSGATLALFAALRDPRVEAMVLANAQVFGRIDDATIDDLLTTGFGATSTYVSKAMSARAWARVASGEVALSKLVSIFAALARRKTMSLLRATRLGPGQGKALEARRNFASLARRGVRMLLVHGDCDVGREELDLCFGPDGRFLRRLDGVTLDVVSGADHALASQLSRAAMLERISAFLRAAETSVAPQRAKSKALVGALALAAVGALAMLMHLE
jgi:alpha-beta hydrolase superfamily lysophospholipase